jgi:GNAT superfamily N-acetyltransferase
MYALRLRAGLSSDIDLLIEIDNDASTLFETMGLHLDAATDLEITSAERIRWSRCLAEGTVLISVDTAGRETGFAVLGHRDGEPFLDQLSVRRDSMGLGIGSALLGASMKNASEISGRFLWLTTYDHLSWNRPFYQRRGFEIVSPESCGEELQRELMFERGLFPAPEHRIVMRRELRGSQ